MFMTERNHIKLIGVSECAIHFERDIRQRHVFPVLPSHFYSLTYPAFEHHVSRMAERCWSMHLLVFSGM
jgi:hypothetical protein